MGTRASLGLALEQFLRHRVAQLDQRAADRVAHHVPVGGDGVAVEVLAQLAGAVADAGGLGAERGSPTISSTSRSRSDQSRKPSPVSGSCAAACSSPPAPPEHRGRGHWGRRRRGGGRRRSLRSPPVSLPPPPCGLPPARWLRLPRRPPPRAWRCPAVDHGPADPPVPVARWAVARLAPAAIPTVAGLPLRRVALAAVLHRTGHLDPDLAVGLRPVVAPGPVAGPVVDLVPAGGLVAADRSAVRASVRVDRRADRSRRATCSGCSPG